MKASSTTTPFDLSTRGIWALFTDSALLVLVLAEGVLAVLFVLALAVFRSYFPVDFAVATSLVESGWVLLSTAAILVGAIAGALAFRAVSCGESAKALLLLVVAIAAGTDFAAVRFIEAVRLDRVHQVLVAQAALVPVGGAGAEAAPEPPDAATGKELYEASCVSCHGAQGEGLARLGAPLLGSAFVQSLGEAELVEFLKVGRNPADPKSVMRGMMPARGGNPTLTDADLGHISAFLLTLAGQAAPTAANNAAAAAPPPFSVHRSVLPPAPAGPAGLSAAYTQRRAFGPDSPLPATALSAPNRFPRLLAAASGLHGLLVLAGLVALALLAAPLLRGPGAQVPRVALFLACAHLQMMAVWWLLMLPFMYGPA